MNGKLARFLLLILMAHITMPVVKKPEPGSSLLLRQLIEYNSDNLGRYLKLGKEFLHGESVADRIRKAAESTAENTDGRSALNSIKNERAVVNRNAHKEARKFIQTKMKAGWKRYQDKHTNKGD